MGRRAASEEQRYDEHETAGADGCTVLLVQDSCRLGCRDGDSQPRRGL